MQPDAVAALHVSQDVLLLSLVSVRVFYQKGRVQPPLFILFSVLIGNLVNRGRGKGFSLTLVQFVSDAISCSARRPKRSSEATSIFTFSHIMKGQTQCKVKMCF